MSSLKSRYGRYVYGGISYTGSTGLTFWERQVFPKDPTDMSYVLTAKQAHRPDLVAFEVYGTASLHWFVMMYNDLTDPIEEFVTGQTIVLPTKERATKYLLTSSV